MAKYHPLPRKEREEAENATPSSIGTRALESALWKCILFSASCLLVGITTIVAFAATHQLLSDEATFTEDLSFMAPPGPIFKTFTIDERFRRPPSPESDEAWRSILPNGLGVVRHPALGHEVVALAFVHQLHCLDHIRKSYFAAAAAARTRDCSSTATTTNTNNNTNNNNNNEEVEEEAEDDPNDKHTLHCLDYIRLSLQCHADTNPEYQLAPSSPPSNSSSASAGTTGGGGFTGYGAHRCRDFERVVGFAEEYRVDEGMERKGRRVGV